MNRLEPSRIPLIRALDACHYTSPDIYRQEIGGLLARTWHFAGHASSLANPGDYFAFEVAEQNLFCIRSQDSSIRCFYNVCQHRAHELVSGQGSCRAVVCPYHAWTYDLDGKLRSGPNTKSVPGFDREDIRLTEVKAELFCGFVFVNLDAEAHPMSDWFPDVEQELRSFVPQIDRLKPLEWAEVPERCNWKASIENYSECYHCKINHRAFATGIIKPETYDVRPQGYCLRHTTECTNLERMSYPIDLDANEHAGEYSSWFLWPMFSFQVYPGNILNTYHWRPHGPGDVTVWRGWYTVDGVDSDVVRRLAAQDRATTVEEDVRLVESVQRGLASRGYKPGPLVIDPKGGVNSEHSILALQRWIREAADA